MGLLQCLLRHLLHTLFTQAPAARHIVAQRPERRLPHGIADGRELGGVGGDGCQWNAHGLFAESRVAVRQVCAAKGQAVESG